MATGSAHYIQGYMCWGRSIEEPEHGKSTREDLKTAHYIRGKAFLPTRLFIFRLIYRLV